MPTAKVISGFPATGKSLCFNEQNGLKILDSDSSNFSWAEKGVRNPDFPQKYIDHIRENLDKSDLIMVSSHEVVREALVKAGIHFTLVFPEKSLKEEYIKRFKDRGNDSKFIKFIGENWDSFIDEMEGQEGCDIERLKSGEFMHDILQDLMN